MDLFVFIYILFTCLILGLLIEHGHFIKTPGSLIYRSGFSVKQIDVPPKDQEQWLALLGGSSRVIGEVNENLGEVYLRKRNWLEWRPWYNPFVGTIRLAEPTTMIVRFSPITALFWLFLAIQSLITGISFIEESIVGFILSTVFVFFLGAFAYLEYFSFVSVVLQDMKFEWGLRKR